MLSVRKQRYYVYSGGRTCSVYKCKHRAKKLRLVKTYIHEASDKEDRVMLYLYTLLIISALTLAGMKIIDLVFDHKIRMIEGSYDTTTTSSVSGYDVIPLADSEPGVYEIQSVMMAGIDDVDKYLDSEEYLTSCMGDDEITVRYNELIKMDLPDIYYGDSIDISSFQPYMDYRKITNTASKGYAICNADVAYVDGNGLLRYPVEDDQFSIGGEDDYIVAMGTFYKPEGTMGQRFLIVTSTGMFTVRTGDEKADRDTDLHNMFTWHQGGTVAAVIEWIVQRDKLPGDVATKGNIVEISDFEELQGDIRFIYRID